jgi:iron complex outermembrane receptor protein
LRDASDGFSAEARFGEYFEGDGTAVLFGANAGFALGDDGFANVTFQWKEQDPTSRSAQRTDAGTLIASGSPGRFAFQSGSGTNCYGDGVTCQLDLDGNPIPLADLSIGAHGFAGFSPQQAGEWTRGNYAVYGDLEADITERFTLAAAVRFEDFQDFGNTTNGKLAARFAFTDAFALRGSVSTGFRAPTPGQANVTKISTVTVGGELQQRGQIPPTNPIATALGSAPLDAEDATNFTLGAVWDVTDTLSLTLDFYQIEIEDRIAQTGTIVIADFDANDPAFNDVNCPTTKAANGDLAECLQETGVPGASDLSSVSFFTNDFDTTTTGVDLVATWALDWGGAGTGSLTAAWNFTVTEVDSAGEEVSRDRVVELENFNPQNRGIFTYQHFIGNLRLLGRASFYDSWIDADDADDDPADPTQYTLNCSNNADQCFDSEWIFDVEAAYTFADKYSVIVGAQNLFDEFGLVDKNNLDGTIGSGNTFSQSTPFGQDGGFWYLRLRADFN